MNLSTDYHLNQIYAGILQNQHLSKIYMGIHSPIITFHIQVVIVMFKYIWQHDTYYLLSFIANLPSSRHFTLSLILTKTPWNSPGKNTGVDSHSLLQGIFSTQGSNMGLLHCRCIIYYLTHQRSRHKADIILHNSLLRKLRLELLQNLPNLSLFLDSGDLEFVTLSDSKAYIFPISFKKQKQKQKTKKTLSLCQSYIFQSPDEYSTETLMFPMKVHFIKSITQASI